MSEWISVDDKLPKRFEVVLVAGVETDTVCAIHEPDGWLVQYEGEWVTGVTHWMPLPEPPNKEK